MTSRQALVLRAFAVWTVYVWLTLIWNIWHDHTKGHGTAFKVVHTGLAVVSITLAVAAWQTVTRVRSRKAGSAPR
jgi:hypothetical protein